MAASDNVDLPDLGHEAAAGRRPALLNGDANTESEIKRTAQDLEAVFDVPVTVSAVLGKSAMEVSQLLKLGKGTIVELDRKVGEAIDIYVNDRLVARGEVVLVEDRLGVTMTEIIKAGQSLRPASRRITAMRLLIVGQLAGPAQRCHQDRDGSRRQGHARRRHRTGACRALRGGHGADLVLCDVKLRHRPAGARPFRRAHLHAGRRLRHRHRRAPRGRRHPRRRQGISAAAARSRTDRRRAGGGRRRQPSADLSKTGDGSGARAGRPGRAAATPRS